MTAITVEFKDMNLLPTDVNELTKFVTTNLAQAIVSQITTIQNTKLRAADPVLDQRGIGIGITISF